MANFNKSDRRQRTGHRGFSHTGGLLKSQMRKVTASRGFSEARLLTHWSEIAGPNLAAITRPVKITFAQSGLGATLIVLAEGARAPEIQMQIPDLLARVNACYGYRAISRVKITQTDRFEAGFAEPQTGYVADKPEPVCDPAKLSALDLEDVKDERLRVALESLSRRVLTKTAEKS